jgi:hypothetical protein
MSIEELIELKAKDYGKPEYFWGSIAEIWTSVTGKHFSPKQVIALMVIMKAKRAFNNPDHNDSWVDIQGYGKIGEDL